MKKYLIVIFALFYGFLGVNRLFAAADTWTAKTDFGGTARYLAVGFSIGSKGYIGTGIDGSSQTKDFWEYDPVANAWTQKADFGGTARNGAVGFSIAGKGYMGTGTDDSVFYKDFWEYDPTANTWTAKTNFGGAERSYAVGFSLAGKGYIGTGEDGSVRYKDFYEYDPTANTWTAKTDFGGTARGRAVGFSIGGKGYLGTGDDGSVFYKDFYEYDPTANSWTAKTDFGGTARELSVGFSVGSKGYIGTGFDVAAVKDFWEYDPGANTWTAKADFGGTARQSAVGFSIGNKGYIGTGYVSLLPAKDFWEYEPTDTTPDAFTFTDQTGVARSTVITSNTITVAGINAAAAISITGGEYSVNAGGYTAVSGTVNNGDTITVRLTSSASYSTTTNATLTIGGVSDTFSVTTLDDTTPDPFTFTDQTGVARSTVITSNTITVAGINAAAAISITGGEYSVNAGGYTAVSGTVNNGDTVTVRQTSSASYSTTTNAVLTIGGVSDTFSVTTLDDTTPDPFTFTDQTGVALSTVITSNTITVAGITGAAAISITGGEYSVNGGAYTGVSGTVSNGNTVTVRQTSSANYSTTTNATLTIGGVSDTFSVTTLDDTTPDPFTFTDQTGVARSTVITSNTITVAGINAAAAISITGGEYSINGGAYTGVSGTVSNGNTVTVRQTSSGSYSTTTNATLTIGGVSDTFSVTTLDDTTPDPFTFTDQTGVARSTVITSNTITVAGINAAAAISITGGEYSINGGAYTGVSGTVSNGNTVTVRQTSSGSYSTTTNATLTIGGVSDTFSVTTLDDTTPDPFTFTDQTDVALSTVITSNTITVAGITGAAAISITGGEYSINGGAYTGVSGTVSNGNTVTVRQTSSANYSTTTNATLTIGGVSDTFSVTTVAPDITPPSLNITSHSNGQHVTTSSITLIGTASDSGKGGNGIQQVTVNGVRANNDTATGSGTANWNKAVTLNAGANTITVVAYDDSSNHNSTTEIMTIYYDVARAPSVTTGPATNMTEQSATLKGTVNPNGLSTTYYFEWGPTTAYGNVTGSQSAGSGWDNVAVSANLTGLTRNANYHYRLVATNSSGTTYGADMSFIASVKAMPWLLLLLGD